MTHIEHYEDFMMFDTYQLGMDIDLNYLTIKYDGAPAIEFGKDESTNLPWISTKTSPKFFSENHIEEFFKNKPELARKLVSCFKCLCIPVTKTTSGSRFKADFLFDLDSLSINEFQNTVTFQPNVIQYQMPFTALQDAKLGLAIHSDGGDIPTSLSSDTNLFKAPIIPWFYKPAAIDQIEVRVNPSKFRQWLSDFVGLKIHKFFKAYVNKKIREGMSRNINANEFSAYVTNVAGVHISGLSSENGRRNAMNKYSKIHNHLQSPMLSDMVSIYTSLMLTKNEFIDDLNNSIATNIRPRLYDENDDLICADHEGFVYDDKYCKFKLVNRDLFSKINFSNNVKRGWQNDRVRRAS